MSTITVNVACKVEPPRGAQWAARAASALLAAIKKWGAARPSTPAPIVEAAQVRAMALSYLRSDPGLAADLFAAADRHESTALAR